MYDIFQDGVLAFHESVFFEGSKAFFLSSKVSYNKVYSCLTKCFATWLFFIIS